MIFILSVGLILDRGKTGGQPLRSRAAAEKAGAEGSGVPTVADRGNEADLLEELIGETMASFCTAAGAVHIAASLVVLASTRGMRLRTRLFLLAVSLLVPVIGPVLAVFTLWPRQKTARPAG
jgi:hypothetical protein